MHYSYVLKIKNYALRILYTIGVTTNINYDIIKIVRTTKKYYAINYSCITYVL